MLPTAIPFRALLIFTVALGLRAETAPSPATFTAAPVPANPMLPDPSTDRGWEQTATLRSSIGWHDNALLSSFTPIGRGFGRAEVDVFLLKQRGDWRFISFVNGDVLRYFSPPPETAGEQLWFLHGETRWQHWPAWRMTLKADGFLQDAVVDLSENERVRTIAPTRAQGAFVTASIRVTLPAGFTLEPLMQVKRVDYRDFPGGYDETKAGARLEWTRSETLILSAAWFEHRRGYAERQDYTAGGRALKGSRLHFRQHAGELRAATAWAGGGLWTSAVTISRLENRDQTSGFFDYDQTRARLELTWQRAAWKTIFDGGAKRVDYLVQTIGAGTTPAARMADNFEVSLRVERELSPAWTLFGEYRWERNRSNETEFNYRANTLLAGVQRNF